MPWVPEMSGGVYRVLAVMLSAAALNGCSSSAVTSANYPSLSSAFAEVVHIVGQAQLVRGADASNLREETPLFVGDSIRSSGRIELTLAPGQIVTLGRNSEWLIEDITSNGAVYLSRTRLLRGSMQVTGDEYMPHQFKVLTNHAEVTTVTENFCIGHDETNSLLGVVSLDAIPITVSNKKGKVTLKRYLDETTVSINAAPTRPIQSTDQNSFCVL